MALRQAKLCSLLRSCGSPLMRQKNVVALTSCEGQRQLTTNPQYKKPFDYKRKKYNIFHALTDFTTSRLNENSRIIMIEGPPCVGKSELAKTLAQRFNLVYMPSITDDDLYIVNGLDIRSLNEMLPSQNMMHYDLSMLYSEKDPEHFLHFSRMQVNFFNKKLFQYVQALRHLLSTGQGVVLENSVWSDVVYALTMSEMGYFSKKGIRWYMYNRRNTLLTLWKPHLIIYLDAPSSTVVQKLKEKNPHYEGSPVLTEKYFDKWINKYKTYFLPYITEHTETLQYDATNFEDIDLLTLDLEGLDLIGQYGNSKFMDWRRYTEEDYALFRLRVCNDNIMSKASTWRAPMDCPELFMNVEQAIDYRNLISEFPQLAINDEKYWYDKEGKLRECKETTPLSLASESHLVQGVVEAGPESKAIAG